MWLRALRRRLFRLGPKTLLIDLIYLVICGSCLYLVTSQLTGGFSDAKAIEPRNHNDGPVIQEPVIQGQENAGIEKIVALSESRNQLEEDRKPPVLVQPVLRKPLPEAKIAVAGKEGWAQVPHEDDAERDDGIKIVQPVRVEPTKKWAGNRQVNGHKYPQLTAAGNFVPMRRIVHLDMKGAPYKVEVFTELFYLLTRLKATGILLEWEDMFPYEGKLKDAVNGNAYTKQQVEQIITEAARHHLEVIPLVQTFAHLEWIFKLDKYAHLRDDPKNPQVACVGKQEAWELIKDMIDQVGEAHKKVGMPYFHIGADEVFHMGVCNETVAMIAKHGNSRERVTLFHIARTAEHVKETFGVTALAWHDMLTHAMPAEIEKYRLPSLIEPVIWSYAEDLDQYLPQSTWEGLKPFPRVWGSSAWKGADGPMRFHSNPVHYVRNHESWTKQFTRNYEDFEYIQGLIMTGWSRYDHLAVLAETLPIGIPALAMGMETVLEGRSMAGHFPMTAEALRCTPPLEPGFVYGCQFPGRKVYELVNDFVNQRRMLRKYASEDFEFNGWLSSHAEKYAVSSAMYINKIVPFVEYHQVPLERLYKELRKELAKIFFEDAVEEFLQTYVEEDVFMLRRKMEAAKKILESKSFPKRPYVTKTEL